MTAVSGSGPAYFFALIEAIARAGAELGLDEKVAMSLTLQTAMGAAALAQQSDDGVAKLERMSPARAAPRNKRYFHCSPINLKRLSQRQSDSAPLARRHWVRSLAK